MTDVSKEAKNVVSSARTKLEKSRSNNKDFALSMTKFLMKIVGLWLAKDSKEQRKRDLTLLYTVLAIMFGVIVQLRDFYYSWPNFSDCTYAACNILSLVMVLLKLSILFVQRTKFMNLLKYTYKHFWHTDYDYNELSLLEDCKRATFLCIMLINFCAQGTVISYTLTPIVENIGKNDSDRILPFNMWLDLPLITTTPYYEIIFVLQVLSLCHVTVCYICFDNLLCWVNLRTATQFRILQYRFSNLGDPSKVHLEDDSNGWTVLKFAKECRASFVTCVRQHQSQIVYCQKLNDLFTMIALGHVLVDTMLLCLTGYEVLLADVPTTRRLVFVFHTTGSSFLLLLFTYSCTGLMEESTNIGTAIYSGPWTNLPMDRIGAGLRNDLRMVIIRSGKPCCLTAAGFFPVSVETFTTVLSTAISYFTILSQSIND